MARPVRRYPYNPIRCTLWLPDDVASLVSDGLIDWCGPVGNVTGVATKESRRNAGETPMGREVLKNKPLLSTARQFRVCIPGVGISAKSNFLMPTVSIAAKGRRK